MIFDFKLYTIRFNFMFGLVLVLAVMTMFFSATAFANNKRYHTIPIGSIAPDKVPLKGVGVVDKIISIEQPGWYELLIHSAPWPTDLLLDEQLVGHLSFSKEAWPNGLKHKIINLFLQKGKHTLRLQRFYHPGLPYIHSIQVVPASDLSGKVNLTPKIDRMVFRAGEPFVMQLRAEKLDASYDINFNIKDANTGLVITTLKKEIPAGTGLFQTDINIPTSTEGVFNVDVRHIYYGQVARSFQYVVIETKPIAKASQNVQKELIKRITPTQLAPDYTSKDLVINNNKQLGPYLESNSNGVYSNREAPDYFAYKLNLPEVSGFYLVEVDYPDNELRTFTISLIEKSVSPYALDSGVMTGGNYPLTHTTQTSRIYFHSREAQPRLLFLNWYQGKRIAVSEIRIYRIADNSLPTLPNVEQSERKFGVFYEEPMRFTSYFGAYPSGNQWTEIYATADRWAKWSNFLGHNLWLQSIANYQHVMWPTAIIPGFAPADEDAFSLLGPVTPYDRQKKDIIRLLLLTAEKYGISFIGELVMPTIGYIAEALDQQFADAEKLPDLQLPKPWLIVSDDGKTGSKSPYEPSLNPVHPAVQAWIESIITELALRYKDSPAFDGLAIRLMGWSFASWQAFPSIHWGYGDFTINKFEQETGIKIPVSILAPDRFKKRYQWLIKNHYEAWIDWRVSSITSYHKRIYNILKNARSDLKLYINTFGPDFSLSDWGKYGGWSQRNKKLEKIGWYKMIRETGVDPLQYKNDSGIIFSNSFPYPAGIRAQMKAKGKTEKQYAGVRWKEANNPESIKSSNKTKVGGSTAAARFGNEYLEYDFPVNWIGYDKLEWRQKKKLRIAANVQPSGRAALQRYAWAMSEGNINFITDGGLGYVFGDPLTLRPFMREYHSLPDIGMEKLPASSVTAVWYGAKDSSTYIYLVNTSGKQSHSSIHFSRPAKLTRITTGKIFTTDANNNIDLTLQPYELIVLKSSGEILKPISYETK